MTLKALIYGVGPIGSLIAKCAVLKGYDIVGAIDIDPSKVGRDLGDVIGLEEKLGVIVTNKPEEAFRPIKPDIVFHATTSWLDKALPQLVISIKNRANIVSTCETLSYPYYRYPHIAELLDNFAKAYGVTVLGTGINPGFLLDTLPAVLSLPHIRVDKITAIRSIDAGKRRKSFQKKIGLGLTLEEFKEKLSRGELTAHVGYAESVYLIADMLGIKLTEVEEGQEPVIASGGEELKTPYYEIKTGQIKGVKGYGRGLLGDREIIRIEFHAIVGGEEYEEIRIEGEPTITWRSTGTPGDISTAAVVVNIAPRVVAAEPGLKTMADLVKASYHIIQ